MSAVIRVSELHFTYPEETAETLHGINLEIEKGSFVAIVGRNGSGKSTLARHFNAVLIPTSGTVEIAGMLTSQERNLINIRSTVGMVFQNPDNQIVNNVVEDDVAFAPENLGIPPEEIRLRVDEALKAVGMYDYRRHAPHLLSGGQKQRIAVAGVLAMRPDVIVLDESTAMLDPRGRQDVITTVLNLKEKYGITILLITHHMDECINADRLIVMKDGNIEADGTPECVFEDIALIEKAGMTIPETIQLAHDLNAAGITIPRGALSIEKCAAAIAAQIGNQQ